MSPPVPLDMQLHQALWEQLPCARAGLGLQLETLRGSWVFAKAALSINKEQSQ